MTTFGNEQNESTELLNEITPWEDALQLLASRVAALELSATQNGRIIPVGNGTGVLNIDGDQLSLNGKAIRLQANDVIEIQAGTYEWIDMCNVTLSVGGVLYVKNNGLVIINEGGFNLYGNKPVKNVVFDFAGFPGLEYGLKNVYTGPHARFHIDTHGIGGYQNITIRGLEFVNVWDRGLRSGAQNIDFTDTGIKAISGLLIEKCCFISDNSPECGGGIKLGGERNEETETNKGYIEDVVIRDIALIGGAGSIYLGNANNYEIYNIKIEGVNVPEAGQGEIITANGWGKTEGVRHPLLQ